VNLDDYELAQQLREAVGMVLDEFLRNAPPIEDARYMVQAAFVVAGLQSLLAEHGASKTAQTLMHGFQMTSGQGLIDTLYGRAPQQRLH
jgi:hypothetical protein